MLQRDTKPSKPLNEQIVFSTFSFLRRKFYGLHMEFLFAQLFNELILDNHFIT